jgi:integrase
MRRSTLKREYAFLPLFEKFIADSKKGRRLQPNGKKISEGTIINYNSTKNLLEKFCREKGFELRIRQERYLNTRETEVEKNYWKKFYKRFTDYLYLELDCFDNYVGSNIKNIKAFFNYLNKDSSIKPGNFHRLFYVRKEEIPIFPLMPEELNFLIYNKEFEQKLSKRLKEAKDVIVFGCTVALRVSDLLNLKRPSLRELNEQTYLAVRSQKTSTDTLIKLPDYAIEILTKYKKLRNGVLPKFNKSNLNGYIKKLFELAGFTQEVLLKKSRRGKTLELKNEKSKNKKYRFCDVVSTHTMRRTAITTMLCLGVPEQIVRKISGHSAGTKEFYRYVLWAQTYQDKETETMFEQLKRKELKAA